MAAKALRNGPVRLLVSAFEQHVGVGDPRDEAARGNRRLRGNAIAATPAQGPFGRQPLRCLARLIVTGSSEVAQPPETVKLARPTVVRRIEVKGRAPVQKRDATSKSELPMLDLVPKAWIGCSQILRHEQELIGGGRPK